MNTILKLFKKANDLYEKLPVRIKLPFLLAVFMVLMIISIGFRQYELQRGKNDNAYLIDNGFVTDGRLSGSGRNEDQVDKEPVQKEIKIVIDPGHGGEDLGAYKGSMYEKVLNLDISLKLGKLLEDLGIKVIYTRKTDIDVSLDERVNIANNQDATLFISVHNNYMPNSADYKGTETLYCPPVNAKYSKMDGRKFAILVQKELVKDLKTIDNGIIFRPNLAVLRKTNMPAVIAEVAYISNSSDRAKLSSEEFRQKAAVALSNAVVNALNEMDAKKDENGMWTVMDD